MIDWNEALKRRLARAATHPEIHSALTYAVSPAGKLFRPRLLESLAQDFAVRDTGAIQALGTALELHHAYSLVHDDMPCMDNDLERRGKPSLHVQYGEWRALLTGDALLALSYAALEDIQHPQSARIRRAFHWATGAKGLIQGQWIDLGSEAKSDAQKLLRMHELKTARLMQVAALATSYLANQTAAKEALRLGRSIGLVFQWLDDLDDLTGRDITEHEREVNPFLLAPTEAIRLLKAERERLEAQLAALPHTRTFIHSFLQQTDARLLENHAVLVKRVKGWS
jgi:geranylgeranyl pyrophosphate synthase